MEVAHVGVRTRARAMAMAMAEEENDDNSGAVKRRKIDDEKCRLTPSTSVQIKSPDRANSVSVSSGDVPASCCSSTGSTDKLKTADLEEDVDEIETVSRYNLERSKSTQTNEFKAVSSELDLTTGKQSSVMISSRRTVPTEKMPPAEELEEFFTAAEKDLHKRFTDKYNYDIVNDIPLKGRYDWIQLKP